MNDTFLLRLLSALCVTAPSPLIPISPSSSPVLNDIIDLGEARGIRDLAEHLGHEGIVAFFCSYQPYSDEFLAEKSDKEFLGK